MAFRGLLFAKSAETNAAMVAACKRAGIRVEVCEDIFTAIEKGKTQAFSCVILDWTVQPEASFLLKRARESTPNRGTVAVAIVDHDPTSAERRDHRLDFLVYRPISPREAEALLTKACEKMQPSSAEDVVQAPGEDDGASSGAFFGGGDAPEQSQRLQPAGFPDADGVETSGACEIATAEDEAEPRRRSHAGGFGGVCAVALVLAAALCLWRSRETFEYLERTREGRFQVLRESVAALLHENEAAALPAASPGSEAQQDADSGKRPAGSDAQTPSLEVIATTEAPTMLPKAPDLPLPVPVLGHQEAAPVRTGRAAIPESVRNSPPIAPPVVETVNPAQMMPVSAPQPQPAIQPVSEPVAVSEEAARARLVSTVDPVYPPEALAQKLHGTVVLQALVARDGRIEDLKIVRGDFVLGRAATAAVRQWRFQPYTLNGHAVATQTLITINFSAPPG